MAQAQGYRQQSPPALQEQSCYALGTWLPPFSVTSRGAGEDNRTGVGWDVQPGNQGTAANVLDCDFQIGYGSNKKTRHMMASGHKSFLVSNVQDVELLLMHNKTHAAEYVMPPSENAPKPTRRDWGMRMIWGTKEANIALQDRPQRFLQEARHHHCPGEAIRCQGHQLQGQGHDRGLNGWQQSWGQFLVCFGASQAVLGNGLLFDCDCLALIRAREYNCGLLRHDNRQLTSLMGFSGVQNTVFLGLSWHGSTNLMRNGARVTRRGWKTGQPMWSLRLTGTRTRTGKHQTKSERFFGSLFSVDAL